jgi:hypothetical protein
MEKQNYNYCCLFSKGGKCKNHGKTVVCSGLAGAKKYCIYCDGELKLLGVALNVVFIGTQESKIKTRKS